MGIVYLLIGGIVGWSVGIYLVQKLYFAKKDKHVAEAMNSYYQKKFILATCRNREQRLAYMAKWRQELNYRYKK